MGPLRRRAKVVLKARPSLLCSPTSSSNELDHKLEERNLGYCRWADDFVIVVRSERAAHRVMNGTVKYLEDELGLIVNQDKSQVAPIKNITFLPIPDT